MQAAKIKAVFDCNIIWQSFFFGEGVSAECKRFVDDDVIELLLSRQILEEVREVMNRPELLAKYSTISEVSIDRYLEDLAKNSRFYRSVPRHYIFERDPDDEPYIDLAIEGKVDFLVTRDRDLLDLMTKFDTESKQFRQKTRPLKIVDPVSFLRILKKSTEE